MSKLIIKLISTTITTTRDCISLQVPNNDGHLVRVRRTYDVYGYNMAHICSSLINSGATTRAECINVCQMFKVTRHSRSYNRQTFDFLYQTCIWKICENLPSE